MVYDTWNAAISILNGGCYFMFPEKSQCELMIKICKIEPTEVKIVEVKSLTQLAKIMSEEFKRVLLNQAVEDGDFRFEGN